MDDNRKNITEGRGMGVGYVTLIMLFAVICLTVLASLSYQAARANDKLVEKSVSFTNSFYEADTRAKETLSQLDEWSLMSFESGFFDDNFPLCCEENENLSVKKIQTGYEVMYKEKISENLELSVIAVFYNNPQNSPRYRIEEWKTVSSSSDSSDDNLNVWDGNMP